MAIVDCHGNEVCTPAPKVVKAVPFGSMVLVEHLTAKEVLGTSLEIDDNTHVGSPQAYIVGFGPGVPKECGLELGNRVLLQGTYVPVPQYGDCKRERGLVEMHNIKAVLVEG